MTRSNDNIRRREEEAGFILQQGFWNVDIDKSCLITLLIRLYCIGIPVLSTRSVILDFPPSVGYASIGYLH